MNNLFKPKTPIKTIVYDEKELIEEIEQEITVSEPLDSQAQQIFRPDPKQLSKIEPEPQSADAIRSDTSADDAPTNFADVLGQLGAASGDETAISGIMELARTGYEDNQAQDKNLAMKAETPHVPSLIACEFMADYNDNLGMPEVAQALRNLGSWSMAANCGKQGKRAGAAFNALNEQQQKEFLLTKEAKGLIQR